MSLLDLRPQLPGPPQGLALALAQGLTQAKSRSAGFRPATRSASQLEQPNFLTVKVGKLRPRERVTQYVNGRIKIRTQISRLPALRASAVFDTFFPQDSQVSIASPTSPHGRLSILQRATEAQNV